MDDHLPRAPRRLMSLFRRAGRIRAANKAAKQATAVDPVQAVGAAHARQVDQLDAARRSVADVAAHRRRVELLAARAAEEEAMWNRQAESAVAARQDDAAREYLNRALTARDRAKELGGRFATLDAQVRSLQTSVEQLEHRIEDSRLRMAALQADHGSARAALAAREASRAADAAAVGQAMAARDAEQEIRRMQARAAAHEEIAGADPDSPAVEEAFDRLMREGEARARLEEMRRRQGIEPPQPG